MGSFPVGGMVGEILPAAGVSAGMVTDEGDGFDIALGGLKFRVSPTDQNPYQRATAQFRKDQLDTGSSSGDQSLTGWWTRSQVSFHKGAGIRFYEVFGSETDFSRMSADGTAVQNRYLSSVGLDPFTPGGVSLRNGLTALSTPTVTNPTRAMSGQYGNIHVALDGGVVKYDGSTYNPSPATVVSVATGGEYIYAARSDNKIQRIDPGFSNTTIYSSANPLTAVFYAKDRLFVVDNTNTWYQLAPNPSGTLPVAIGSGDVAFTAAAPPVYATWGLTDTTGPVLISAGERVFALTQDSSGGYVSLSAPIQVIALPAEERVIEMAFYLGYIILNTTAGVRVGVISDAGQINYGPLLVEWTTPAENTTIARRGSRVIVAGDHRLIEINLAQQVGNSLEFAWCDLASPFTGSETSYGTYTINPSGALVVWGGSQMLWGGGTTDLGSPGTLRTAYHRFGTMEPKWFSSATIRIDGAGGTVAVRRVDADGTVTSLYTMDASTSHVETIDLGLSVAGEMVALEFELTASVADPSVGPTLLGYQIKAMPAPQRMRMIRVPVLINDVSRRQSPQASGHSGGAWEQLALLEDLESTDTLVRYQDFRTGETCDVFVESIEFQNTTPPSGGSSGFGGFAFITLRKLR